MIDSVALDERVRRRGPNKRSTRIDRPGPRHYATQSGVCQSVVNRTLEVHAWLLAALLVGVLGLMASLLFMLHVHAGDVAYIAHTHRPIVVVPTGAPPVVSS